jgi:hypothetical protein
MIKKTIKIFSLPIILAISAIIFHFNIDQNLLTWSIEKLIIASSIIASFIAFPLYLTVRKNKELSIQENFKKVKPRLYSFWKSVLLLLALLLGYYLLFFIICYFLPWQEDFYSVSDIIFSYALRLLFPYLFTVFFGIKYVFTPLISLFEEKGFFASLWASRKRASAEIKFNLASSLILFSILISFLSGVVQHFYSSLTFLISLTYLNNFLFLIVFCYLAFKNYQKLEEEKDGFDSKMKKIPAWTAFLVGSPLLLIFLYFSFAISFLDYDPQFSDSKSKELEIEITKPKREGNLYYFFKDEGIIDYQEDGKGCANLEVEDPGRFVEESSAQFIKENPHWS